MGAATAAGYIHPYAHHLMKIPANKATRRAPAQEPITIAATSPPVRPDLLMSERATTIAEPFTELAAQSEIILGVSLAFVEMYVEPLPG